MRKFSIYLTCLSAVAVLVALVCTAPAIAQQTKSDSKSAGEQRRQQFERGRRERQVAVNSATDRPKSVPRLVAKVDPDLAQAALESAETIDRLVTEKLRAEDIRPNPMTDDSQFVRRIYLEINGTIPTARQVTDFLDDRSKHKRAVLIDKLLNSEGYVSHSYNYWADILRLRDAVAKSLPSQGYLEWVKQSLAEDTPYDEWVRELVTAEGHIWENPAAGYMLRDEGMQLDSVDNTVRVFLGTRIGCAQCHDHPFDVWTQKEFYELAAFVYGADTAADRFAVRRKLGPLRRELRRSDAPQQVKAQVNRLVRANTMAVRDKPDRQLKLPDDYQYGDASGGDLVEPKVIFGEQPAATSDETPRQVFANWLTSPENPRFTLTIANRLWSRTLGRGIIDPVDDITDDSQPTNGPLLDHLVAEMKRVNYSQKEFLRIIYNAKTFQRVANDRELAAGEVYYFPGPLLRRMSAEQMWDSLLTLTIEDPNAYQRPVNDELINTIAIDLSQPVTADILLERVKTARSEVTKARRSMGRNQIFRMVRASEIPAPVRPDHFLRQFGQGDRETIAGSNTEGHVPQILTMINGDTSHKMLSEGTVIYREVMQAVMPADKIEVVFLSLLSRKPSSSDRKIAMQQIRDNGVAGLGDIVWALMNTTEFMFIQ